MQLFLKRRKENSFFVSFISLQEGRVRMKSCQGDTDCIGRRETIFLYGNLNNEERV
jgi:hypothetical protein